MGDAGNTAQGAVLIVDYVVVDTTTMYEAGGLEGNAWKRLADGAKRGHYRIVVPEVVRREREHQLLREIRDLHAQISSSLDKLQRKTGHVTIQLPDVSTLIDDRSKRFRERLVAASVDTELGGVENLSLNPILDAALERRKPFGGKAEKGFRDAVVWQCTMELAMTGSVAFITSNTSDFGADGHLHPDLIADMERRGLPPERISWFMTVGSFLEARETAHAAAESTLEAFLQSGFADAASVEELIFQRWDGVAAAVTESVQQASWYLTDDPRGLDLVEIGELELGDFGGVALVQGKLLFTVDAGLPVVAVTTEYDYHYGPEHEPIDRRVTVPGFVELAIDLAVAVPSGELVSLEAWADEVRFDSDSGAEWE